MECNGSELRKNPELFRELLKNSVAEVAFGKSGPTTPPNQTAPTSFAKQEAKLRSELKNCMDEIVDAAWTNLEIAEKLSAIHQLEEQYPKDYVAWRPTVGSVPLLTMKMQGLKEMEERLLYKINKYDAQIETAKAELDVKRSNAKAFMGKLSEARGSLLHLHNDYEKLLETQTDLTSIAKKDNNEKESETK